MKLVIFTGGGHGPDTPGKRSPDGTLREFQFNKPVTELFGRMIQEYKDTEVHYLHDTSGKTDVALTTRTNQANAYYNAHIKDIQAGKIKVVYVSIHANGFGNGREWPEAAKGSETLIYSKGNTEAYKLAQAMEKHVKLLTGSPSRGIVERPGLHELRVSKMPAVLHEAAFMTNRADLELLKSDSFREKVARGLTYALAEVYQLQPKNAAEPIKKAEPAKTPVKAPNLADKTGALYYIQAGAFSTKAAAELQQAALKAAGFNTILKGGPNNE